MSDRLEDFVKKQQEQFDMHDPDPSIWLKINPVNDPAIKEHKSMRWLRVAAAIAMIFAGSTAGIYFLSGGKADVNRLSNEIYLEMQETEQYYGLMVSQRYEELMPFLASDPVANEMLTADMEELDNVYTELKKDLKDNASNPEVVEAMILNYRVKLEILEDLLNQLKEKENQDYETDESYSL